MRVQRWLDEDEPAPDPDNTADLLRAINLDETERERILRMARAADTDLLVSGPPGINPQLASVLECERFATRIFEFQLVWWPGLLQDSAYARAVISRDGSATPEEIESRVMIRNARRDAITRTTKPVVFGAVVASNVARGRFAGDEVRATQLTHVRKMAELDNVTIQITNVGDVWTPNAPFIIYEFDDMPTTVYLEGYRSSAFIVDADVVADYQAAAETLRREAMSPEETAELIADVIPNGRLETT